MIRAALASLAACVGLALAAPRLGRLIRPDVATRLLAGVCVTTAGAVAWVIALAASTSVAQIPIVARAGDWSPRVLAEVDPVPRWLAVGCTAITAWALACGVRTAASQLSGIVRQHRALAGHSTGRLTVVDDPRGIAFATPARGGRIVVSTGMLRALEPDERRALLAHESAHVRHHDYWWVAAARVAAAACPFVRATARGVVEAAERWADEDAAEAVGDRTVVARALARAALYSSRERAPRGAMAAANGQVLGRVEAMLAPPPVRRAAPVWILAGLLAVSLVTAWVAGVDADAVFDRAATMTTVDGPPEAGGWVNPGTL